MTEDRKTIWAYLIHLGYNMWSEPLEQDGYYEGAPKIRSCRETQTDGYTNAKPYLRCDMGLWRELAAEAAKRGVNMFVIDIGEALQYESHPELACEGALSKTRLLEELEYLRNIGIEPIPKLNFSACHDMWLGEYAKMLCTPIYYKVCSDIIHEVSELFSNPRLFHLGMDEEVASWQVGYNLIMERQGDLWWHDLLFLVKKTEECGARAWIWSDYMWHHEELFFERMPKEVLQSNWFYRNVEPEKMPSPVYMKYLQAFAKLAEKGYDQVPAGSNCVVPDNFSILAGYMKNNIDTTKILGFMQTVWKPTLSDVADKHKTALAEFPAAIKAWNG